jgi:hypothetical protein
VTPLKSLVLAATVLAGSLPTAEAKSATGIYLTAEDYIHKMFKVNRLLIGSINR